MLPHISLPALPALAMVLDSHVTALQVSISICGRRTCSGKAEGEQHWKEAHPLEKLERKGGSGTRNEGRLTSLAAVLPLPCLASLCLGAVLFPTFSHVSPPSTFSFCWDLWLGPFLKPSVACNQQSVFLRDLGSRRGSWGGLKETLCLDFGLHSAKKKVYLVRYFWHFTLELRILLFLESFIHLPFIW